MKKIALLALAALMIVGCDKSTNSVDGYDVVIIDSCEYIRNENFYWCVIVHKGNCRFCQERMRKVMLEVRDSLLWSVE